MPLGLRFIWFIASLNLVADQIQHLPPRTLIVTLVLKIIREWFAIPVFNLFFQENLINKVFSPALQIIGSKFLVSVKYKKIYK